MANQTAQTARPTQTEHPTAAHLTEIQSDLKSLFGVQIQLNPYSVCSALLIEAKAKQSQL